MTQRSPVPRRAVNIVHQWDDGRIQPADRGAVLPWELGLDRLSGARLYWHVSQPGDPAGPVAHVRPVFAVVCDGVLCSTSSATARKAHHLAHDGRCTLATSTDDLDLVYEGVATIVHDAARAQRVADAYRDKYGWPVDVTEDAALDAPFGAPSAGPPPYVVYAFEPVTVRGLGTDEHLAPRSTRWDFGR